ncbi:MAG: DNA-3-methyladenine glycosylase [Cellulosilyticaceae bacterium]
MKAILPQAFYLRDGLEVAKDLLGKVMVREVDGLVGAFKIVETEAYLGPEDKGAHTYGGKVTPRTAPLFESGGMTYVYLIYGMYHCLNIGANQKGMPHCVLIRAVEPINEDAFTLCKAYRKIKSSKVQDLTNGPGKLCMALNIDKTLNGIMVTNKGPLYITEGEKGFRMIEDKRINIDYAEEYRDRLWRFYIENNKYVSVLKKGD